jgi:hypothetical protein
MHRTASCLTTCLILTATGFSTGCVSSNYDFAAAPSTPAPNSTEPNSTARADTLTADLHALTDTHPATHPDDALYDLSVLPLLHSELHVFAEAEEHDAPAAYVEADLVSCLPLFAFANGTVRHYDADHRLLTEHTFDSSFWGAFRNHRETVMTHAGPLETHKRTYLWGL